MILKLTPDAQKGSRNCGNGRENSMVPDGIALEGFHITLHVHPEGEYEIDDQG
jgi:hypothetical protein